jgi:hypothetical protein
VRDAVGGDGAAKLKAGAVGKTGDAIVVIITLTLPPLDSCLSTGRKNAQNAKKRLFDFVWAKALAL